MGFRVVVALWVLLLAFGCNREITQTVTDGVGQGDTAVALDTAPIVDTQVDDGGKAADTADTAQTADQPSLPLVATAGRRPSTVSMATS